MPQRSRRVRYCRSTVTQVQGIPYRRHGPTAALREFLDPLDPGDYFDCGRARLHGLDDALLDEARSRGRAIGDDAFLLVATDMGLVFCRPSISFAIAARWEDISLIRPRGDDPVVLPVAWPRHGELKFTLSKRLAGNIFRRWLQLRMHAARRARQAAAESGRHRPTFDGDTGPNPILEPVPEPATTPGPTADLDPDPGVELDVRISTADHDHHDDHHENDGRRGGDVFALDPVLATGPSAGRSLPSHAAADPMVRDEPAESGTPVETESSGSSTTAARVPTGGPATTGGVILEVLVDEELERVPVPAGDVAPASWVGSAVSLVASLVVLSTLVLIAAVSISLYRGAVGDGVEVAAGDPGEVVVDHERFRPSADPARGLPDGAADTAEEAGDGAADGAADDTAAGAGDGAADAADADEADGTAAGPTTSAPDDGLTASAPGGASQAESGSRQQLLAMSPDSAGPLEARRCSSNYGGCVPDVDDLAGADVDCAGRGDGPYFADGEVVVLGPDIYGLDTDGDGVACEADQPDQPAESDQPAGPGEGGPSAGAANP